MGSYLSRQLNNAVIEETDNSVNNFKYKYPPKTGNYFSTTFIMGGEKFNTPSPENYLFGENTDLNFLGSKPTSFPYSPPNASEPTKTLKSLVNIRKESVKFVKVTDTATKIDGTGTVQKGNSFNIEFVFDSDTKCAITIYYFCTEDIASTGVAYSPRDPSLTSETYIYPKGANQVFVQPTHMFNPSMFSDEDLLYNSEKDVFPMVIHCVADEGTENIEFRQSHTTICVVDHHTDGTYVLRALKQKIFVDGLCYLLQEIYGIENKNLTRPINDDDLDDNGSECVICMCDARDTLILPCRHLCLCNSCADSLRYQANNCPICRSPFRALLRLIAVKASPPGQLNISNAANCPDNTDGIPHGYSSVSLIEALNGPITCISDKKDSIPTVEMLNKELNDIGAKVSPVGSLKRGSKEKLNQNGTTDNFRLANMKSSEDSDLLSPTSITTTFSHRDKKEKSLSRNSSNKDRDCVKYINEKTSNNDLDDDSEAEKLSPLLVTDKSEIKGKMPQIALHMDAVEDAIDTDTEVDLNELKKDKCTTKLDTETDRELREKADDSDYYTPEDPHTTILSPLYSEKMDPPNFVGKTKTGEIVTPVSALKDSDLPDSPISGNSQVSTRSSGDSYSSSSSTRQLLSVPPDAAQAQQKQVSSDNKIDDEIKTHKTNSSSLS